MIMFVFFTDKAEQIKGHCVLNHAHVGFIKLFLKETM